jgi:hypothetical protein
MPPRFGWYDADLWIPKTHILESRRRSLDCRSAGSCWRG